MGAWASGAGGGGSPGQNGTNGKSAYELAVQNGYVGTLSQWLASLQGSSGSTGATGATGAAGAAGQSAYAAAVANGFVGTEMQWLDSLEGSDGSPSTDVTVEVADGVEWAYGITNEATGKTSRVRLPNVGWTMEHPIETTHLGSALPALDESTLLTVGVAAHQGAVLTLGRSTTKSYTLESVSNATSGGVQRVFTIRAGANAVTISPFAGDTLDHASGSVTIAARTSLTFVCDSVNKWWTIKPVNQALTATAVCVDFAIADLRSLTPITGAIYRCTDWPSTRGSFWVPNTNGLLEPLGGQLTFYHRAVPWTASSNSGEQVADVAPLPGGVLQPGWRLRIVASPTKSGQTDTLTPRFRLTTNSGGTGGTSLGTLRDMTSNRVVPFDFTYTVINNTTLWRGPSSSPDGAMDPTTSAPSSFTSITLGTSLGTSQYVSSCVQLSTGTTDTIGSQWCLMQILV